MTKLSAICVYCGSSDGTDPAMLAAAEALGRTMAEAGIGLVYGGGNNGLMGAVARAVLAGGGRVTGIIPDFLRSKERMLEAARDPDQLEMVVVDDMHTRKRLMFERADAFVALPGGVGTLEELVEQMTWVQLDRHSKPVVIADIGGFWGPLLSLIDHMREQGFIRADADVRYRVADTVAEIIPTIRATMARAERTGAVRTGLDLPM
ncbi:TIGR00730 family Rossman fold protein [Lichenibacterium ramalinae]|uniref:Cytokinin riboside 5'-monophosphate phosphoribohydrolase n=1 Tax=Lichenibacterium ramalinae TaxID=2316527 RepID=A0A4Q2RHL7_9HYPH|nr:TIGR00730 family Rossman fold protein [Lichenibacterium ramalinae]RYB06278.1 TIGR00730 family Rossman fold protein [Lichenibacterium ramalinae]